ncbi:hypothetical protein C9374_002274 [Naegleria lovaniensis]|uniref:2Fe-2S ferredoxin-type domain-containing protein n=1 Tax=Naegleria lovaniensis TaxID=51637 RepID=A0AA88KK89_NAELO|nr:uncharacterized protein C9374_002274 [Naegleria lovaniensis]KAG2386530.1 hypothetical protein C9374_002274 [Naegleria lovaniensis]
MNTTRKVASLLSKHSFSHHRSSNSLITSRFNSWNSVRCSQVSAKDINHTCLGEPSKKHNTVSKVVNISIYDREGKIHEIKAYSGETLLESMTRAGVEVAADPTCMGGCACVGCHVIISGDYEQKLPQCSEDEAEVLEEAPFVHENSRLACQIIVEKKYEGMVLALPPRSNDEAMDPYFRF